MIKLTTLSGKQIFVNPKNITSIYRSGSWTYVNYPGTASQYNRVQETPEEILNLINNG